MSECQNLSGCSFVNCCKEYSKADSVQGFINLYCKGNKMTQCVRRKIAMQIGKEHVPKNMMPNGLPLPGTSREDWTEQAIHFRSYIK